jgi:hypothetical protein
MRQPQAAREFIAVGKELMVFDKILRPEKKRALKTPERN